MLKFGSSGDRGGSKSGTLTPLLFLGIFYPWLRASSTVADSSKKKIKRVSRYYCCAKVIMNVEKFPSFEDLPLSEGDPPYSAWGLWKEPQLGSLNHLDEEKVLEAAKEIRTGTRIGLK